jgi:choline dehydrogenase
MQPNMEYDYIVVGTGSAGSVVAARLSERPDVTVLVLEAGGKDTSPWIHLPVGFAKTLNGTSVNWNFDIEPQANTQGRSMWLPRGRVLGGSSSINGMLYVRGNARDYDTWAQLGNRGWSYADVLPFFKRTESRASGDDTYHGRDGPLTIDDPRVESELMEATIRAGQEIGYPHNPDYNGAEQTGFGYYQVTQKGGLRQSAYRAFLKPALSRKNIHLLTGAMAQRVEMANGEAVGVTFKRGGKTITARARREVVLSAGAVQSPQLLELSGIGDPAVLSELGIAVTHALPGVGNNYIDHYMTRQTWRCQRPVSLNEHYHGFGLVKSALRFLLRRDGPLTSPTALVAGFVKTRAGLEVPDVQYHIMPASYHDPVRKILEPEPGLTIGTYQMRPESRGSIHIRSAEPSEQPRIRGNYLSADFDLDVLVAGVKIARDLVAAQALTPYISHETYPGSSCVTDEDVRDFALSTGVAIYHPVGTCKMGVDDQAVVDEQLRVRGVGRLRVMDASVMPTMTSGNTHAPTMMIAERGAEFMRLAG